MGTQKVVIPRGLINPSETVVVEIPEQFKDVSTVVARPKSADMSIPLPPTPKNRLVAKPGRTWPKADNRGGFGALYDDEGITWGGRPNEEESSYATPSPRPPPPPKRFSKTPPGTYPQRIPRRPWYMGDERAGITWGGKGNRPMKQGQRPRPPGWAYQELSPGPVTYPGKFGSVRYHTDFDPNPALHSTLRDLDDPIERTMYCDFRPSRGMSPRPNSLGESPDSLRHWHSSLGSVSPPLRQKGQYYSDSSPEESPEGSPEQYGARQALSFGDSSEEGGAYCGSPECAASPESSGGDSGEEAYYQSPPPPPPPTVEKVQEVVDDLETRELKKFIARIRKYQNARRGLVFTAATLDTAQDIARSAKRY
ncbi:hypothetical protein TcasGA2_TC016377 [Tribolium castaneum]|uniref:Uncharacterized protein n=1 Tax=Tribolium castaneum TaxID=7070 RepID=D6WPB7_TRICA|nr:hypothetical protein TcasGA2_TC016377 [Tribolium castaneum]